MGVIQLACSTKDLKLQFHRLGGKSAGKAGIHLLANKRGLIGQFNASMAEPRKFSLSI